MEEDFAHQRVAPGTGGIGVTSRGWMEHRSRLGHYPQTIRFSWILAAIHDNLKQGEVQQARARCCLALAAVDQSAIDQGSWALAQEFLLENAPPSGAFANRRPVDQGEQLTTRLVDERFIELMMWRLRDRDSYLNQNRAKSGYPAAPSPAANAKAVPKGNPKGKAKAKPLPAADDAPPGDS